MGHHPLHSSKWQEVRKTIVSSMFINRLRNMAQNHPDVKGNPSLVPDLLILYSQLLWSLFGITRVWVDTQKIKTFKKTPHPIESDTQLSYYDPSAES